MWRDVLASPKLRARVAEQLGGAPALERWRRKNTWNKARLAAIAIVLWPHELDGQYVPGFESRVVRPGNSYSDYTPAPDMTAPRSAEAGAPP